ncbi:MAG: exodeoxyribonuclease VII large subunit [Phycisphaerae bacterium]
MMVDHPLFSQLPSPQPPKAAKEKIDTPATRPQSKPPSLPSVITVSQACDLLEPAIKSCTPHPIAVRGEITNWTIARSGHAYFSLRDEEACLESIMWKRDLARMELAPADGLKIVATGMMNFYRPRGQVNFHVSAMMQEGRGELELRYRELCRKLHAEGLFNPDRKRKISPLPMRIGLITSDVGDAVFDVVTTALHRFPPLQIFLFPVRVQGDGAAEDIIEAIEYFNSHDASLGNLDAIMLVRGGGSLEDLWAFNDEQLARTIAASRIPVATGIGHEPDQTIADLVADAVGPTPTGVAQKIVADAASVADAVAHDGQHMIERLLQDIDTRNRDIDSVEAKLENISHRRLSEWTRLLDRFHRAVSAIEPSNLAAQKKLALQSARQNLIDAVEKRLEVSRPRLEQLQNKILHATPATRIARSAVELDSIRRNLHSVLHEDIRRTHERCRHFTQRLVESHPDKILNRGFSITMRDDGHIIRSIDEAPIGRKLITRLADGRVITVVESTLDEPTGNGSMKL